MSSPSRPIAFVGFGEAGMAFADGMAPPVRAYDRKTDVDATRAAKLSNCSRYGVRGEPSNRAAVHDAVLILSLVTADSAIDAARETARSIAPQAFYCDMNSVAPETKRAAAELIEAAGGRYADVAVMAPVGPQRRAVPLLVSGPHAQDASAALIDAGFSSVRIAGSRIGDASAIKMIRSVMVKGLEALTTECMLAADRAGVRDAVVASLNASWPGTDWAAKADYNLERMMAHGIRRAEEMAEVVKTLDALGTGSAMTRGTVERQRAIGRLGLAAPQSLDGKIAAVLGQARSEAA